VLYQKDLAETLRRVATEGAEVFYRGQIAEQIVRYIQAHGGLLSSKDLRDCAPTWLTPAQISYRDYQIYAPAPPCQAVQYLQTLKIMEGFDVASMGHNSVETLHRFIEAAKLCIADRAEYAAIANAPTQGLLSDAYAQMRRALITDRARYSGGERYTAHKAPGEVLPGQPPNWMKDECTTHFDAVDAEGNAVSCTQSLGSGFGSAMVVPGTGIALNNFMRWFDLEKTSPNAIGPAKKNEMCLSPAQVWDRDGLRLLIGTPGSYGILQTTPQMIMNVLDHGMNVQAAIEAARLRTGSPGYVIEAETRIAPEVFAELEKCGHQFNYLGDWSPMVGGGQGIMVDAESGSFMGGADPRRDGYALGW
jgi:gamma-glutamyltranspeptidase/glutathione hydrolase